MSSNSTGESGLPQLLEPGDEGRDRLRVLDGKRELVISVIGVVGEVGGPGNQLAAVDQDKLGVHGAPLHPDRPDLDAVLDQSLVDGIAGPGDFCVQDDTDKDPAPPSLHQGIGHGLCAQKEHGDIDRLPGCMDPRQHMGDNPVFRAEKDARSRGHRESRFLQGFPAVAGFT